MRDGDGRCGATHLLHSRDEEDDAVDDDRLEVAVGVGLVVGRQVLLALAHRHHHAHLPVAETAEGEGEWLNGLVGAVKR
jgi:hypothetical protein